MSALSTHALFTFQAQDLKLLKVTTGSGPGSGQGMVLELVCGNVPPLCRYLVQLLTRSHAVYGL